MSRHSGGSPRSSQQWFILSLALVSAVSAATLVGQVTTAQIRGVVLDSQGFVVPGARPVIQNEQTGQGIEVQSNEAGGYVARSLPLGRYSVTVEHSGFKRYSRTGVEVTANQIARVDVTLEVGAIAETVTVAAELPPVNTTTATLESLIDERRLVDLPLNGRNILALAALNPAVTRTGPYL